MLDLRIATYLAIALFFIRKAMRKARKPVKEPVKETTNKNSIVDTIKKCQNYDIMPSSKSLQDAVAQLFADRMANDIFDVVDRTVLTQIMTNGVHNFPAPGTKEYSELVSQTAENIYNIQKKKDEALQKHLEKSIGISSLLSAEEAKNSVAVDVEKLFADRHAMKQKELATRREKMEAERKCVSSLMILK